MKLQFELATLPEKLDQLAQKIKKFEAETATGFNEDDQEFNDNQARDAFDLQIATLAEQLDFSQLLIQLDTEIEFLNRLPFQGVFDDYYHPDDQKYSQYETPGACYDPAMLTQLNKPPLGERKQRYSISQIITDGCGRQTLTYRGTSANPPLLLIGPTKADIESRDDLSKVTPIGDMQRAAAEDAACQEFKKNAPLNPINTLIKNIIEVEHRLQPFLTLYWGCVLFNAKKKQDPSSITDFMRASLFLECKRLFDDSLDNYGNPRHTQAQGLNDARNALLNTPIFRARHPELANLPMVAVPEAVDPSVKVSTLLPASKLTAEEKSWLVSENDTPIAIDVQNTVTVTKQANNSTLELLQNSSDLSDMDIFSNPPFLNVLQQQLQKQGLAIKAAHYQQIHHVTSADGKRYLKVVCNVTEIGPANNQNDDTQAADEKPAAKTPLITVRVDYLLPAVNDPNPKLEVVKYGVAQHNQCTAIKASDLINKDVQIARYRAVHANQMTHAVAWPVVAGAVVAATLFLLAFLGVIPATEISTAFKALGLGIQVAIGAGLIVVSSLICGAIAAGITYLVSKSKGSVYLDDPDFPSDSLTNGMKVSDSISFIGDAASESMMVATSPSGSASASPSVSPSKTPDGATPTHSDTEERSAGDETFDDLIGYFGEPPTSSLVDTKKDDVGTPTAPAPAPQTQGGTENPQTPTLVGPH